MPLKIVTARSKKTKNLYIRGSYLGVAVDRSCKTDRGSVARDMRKRIEGEIERGEYGREAPAADRQQPTFLSAAVAYLRQSNCSKKFRKYVAKLIKHFGETPIPEIDQKAIEEAANVICPNTTAGTKNACVFTPASTILHHHYGDAGLPFVLHRPEGAKGNVCKDWATHEDMAAILAEAEAIDAEFALFLLCLLYTGLRPHEPLAWNREQFIAAERAIWTRRGKGGATSDIKLPPAVSDRMERHLTTHDRRRIFRFHQGGHLTYLLVRAKLAALGIPCPVRRPVGWRQPPNRFQKINFKIFRHTWATWMRRYGKATIDDLLDSGNWLDPKSVRRYVHAAPVDSVWDRVNDLPSVGSSRGKIAS